MTPSTCVRKQNSKPTSMNSLRKNSTSSPRPTESDTFCRHPTTHRAMVWQSASCRPSSRRTQLVQTTHSSALISSCLSTAHLQIPPPGSPQHNCCSAEICAHALIYFTPTKRTISPLLLPDLADTRMEIQYGTGTIRRRPQFSSLREPSWQPRVL